MKNHSSHYIKNLLLPCLSFSVIAGILSTLFVTIFQTGAEYAVLLSRAVYGAVRERPTLLPALILGAALIGLWLARTLKFCPTCRGGGIPTSIAGIQGIIPFRWITSVFVLPFAAILSFICGLPLGTEGPCVQMGTGVGDMTVRIFGGKKHEGWRRYIMTGGASAGFSLVTGAPITAIVFSMEELHKRFSPLLFSVAAISVTTSQLTSKLLTFLGVSSGGLFHIGALPALPAILFFIPLLLGLLSGSCSMLFTRLYHKIDKLMRITLEKMPLWVKIPLIFVCVALIGFFLAEILGSGHSLVEQLFARELVWLILIVVFLVRAVLMMIANTVGVTGGIFLPTLAFGAILGSLSAEAFISLGVIGDEHYLLLVILGMISFLGATSRIPLTACVFAIEAMSCGNNILPIVISATAAFLIVELSGTKDFSDTVIELKEHALHKGKTPHSVKVPLTVCEGSFVVGKDLRDILWPVSCVVLSIDRAIDDDESTVISVGDVITVHYKTYDPVAVAEEFEALVGNQTTEIDKIMRPV